MAIRVSAQAARANHGHAFADRPDDRVTVGLTEVDPGNGVRGVWEHDAP